MSCHLNMGKKQVRIPLLTPVARFQVDPRVYQVDHEFSIDEILEQVNVGEELGEAELEGLKAMLATRRALFRTTLRYAHGLQDEDPHVGDRGLQGQAAERHQLRPFKGGGRRVDQRGEKAVEGWVGCEPWISCSSC